jgi:nicotinate-nucleotide adenylyltransferase
LRIGLLGGTFDPIHYGHLAMAETALRMAHLNAVYFVTSTNPPHKSQRAHANFLDRHAMVALALAQKPQMVPSSVEYGRAGKSYSIDTVRQFKQSAGNSTRIFFLIGMDAFLDITSWKDYMLFPKFCSFIVFARPGFPEEELTGRLPETFLDEIFPVSQEDNFQERAGNELYLLRRFSHEISSTVIRNQVRRGGPISQWVPSSVEEYIHKTGLYRV